MNRPLNNFERAVWLLDQAVNQNFVMVANMSGLLTDSILRQALDIVQQRHPTLKCKFKDGEIPGFVSDDVPQIPLRIIERKDENHWINEVEKEILEPLPWRIGPMVRAVLLRSGEKCDLLVTFCHITADAISGVKFIKNLLITADKLIREETLELEPTLAELPAALDLLRDDLKYPPAFLYLPTRISKFIHKPVTLPADKQVPILERITRVVQRILFEDETKKLVARCRKEKATVHTALCAALMQTLVEQARGFPDTAKKGPLMIGCLTPVNISHLFSIPVEDDIGNFISDASHFQRIDDKSSLWAAARKVGKALNKELEFGKDLTVLRVSTDLLKNGPTSMDILKDIEPLYPPACVTNIGRVDIPGKLAGLILENLHFALSANPGAPGGIMVAVSTFRDMMTLNFHYLEPCLSKTRVDKIVESTMKRLKEAIRE
jgi:NRPS condensation-like uncharacterized protein